MQNQLIAEVMEKKHRLQTLSAMNSNASKVAPITDSHQVNSSTSSNNNNAPTTAAVRSLRSTGPSLPLSELPEIIKPVSAAIKRRGASAAAAASENTSTFPSSNTNHSSSFSAALHTGPTLTPATLAYALPDSSMR